MKAVIVSGGNPPSKELLMDELKNNSLLICADGGGEALKKYGLIPDILLGDFDSISKDTFNYFTEKKTKIVTYPKEKDFTDTEVALQKALELKAKEICFLGCTGTRLDHTLSNIGLLKKCLENEINAYILDDNNKIFLKNKTCVIYKNSYKYFSLLSYGSDVITLTIKGAKYDLDKYKLNLGEPITVSNEFLEDKVSIEFPKGLLLLIYSKD